MENFLFHNSLPCCCVRPRETEHAAKSISQVLVLQSLSLSTSSAAAASRWALSPIHNCLLFFPRCVRQRKPIAHQKKSVVVGVPSVSADAIVQTQDLDCTQHGAIAQHFFAARRGGIGWIDGWPCVVVVFSFTTYFYPGTTTTSVSDHTQENLLFSLSLTQFSSGRTRRVIKLAPIELFPVIAVHLRKCK